MSFVKYFVISMARVRVLAIQKNKIKRTSYIVERAIGHLRPTLFKDILIERCCVCFFFERDDSPVTAREGGGGRPMVNESGN